jgi:hypothetical protein
MHNQPDAPRGMYITNQPADAAYSTPCINKKLLPLPAEPAVRGVSYTHRNLRRRNGTNTRQVCFSGSTPGSRLVADPLILLSRRARLMQPLIEYGTVRGFRLRKNWCKMMLTSRSTLRGTPKTRTASFSGNGKAKAFPKFPAVRSSYIIPIRNVHTLWRHSFTNGIEVR